MSRNPTRARRRLLAALVGGLLLGVGPGRPLQAAPEKEDAREIEFSDLSARTQKDVAQTGRTYLDPQAEFVWKIRKAFVIALGTVEEEQGVNPIKDIGLLRRIVYQVRHFLPRFTNRQWQRKYEIDFEETSGIYRNLKSEMWRFTYTVPPGYPDERGMNRIPRPDPLPLLVSIHEPRDDIDHQGQAQKYPGEAVLKRRYPKSDFASLYDNRFVLAPVAAGARFLNADNNIRHRVLTMAMTEFWRHYNVDFDSIVLDGTAPAAALVAAFPHVFAGLVLRGGPIESEVVRNYASVPVFVVENDELARTLEKAGHPNVTTGTAKDVAAWLNQRKRVVPSSFEWTMLRNDHKYPNWVCILSSEHTPERTLSVTTLDTEDDPNTIRIEASGIEQISLFLNDDIVDLDREVRLVVNGEESVHTDVKRDFGQLFDLDPPGVRKNMNFGWLYPVLLKRLPVPVPWRLRVQRAFLQGRPDRLDALLEGRDGPVDRFPLALRDLWWRRTHDVAVRARYAALAEHADGLLRDQYRWILGGGEGPYPAPDLTALDPAQDPWPILTALVLDRLHRERKGVAGLPDGSPLATCPVPDEETDWYAQWRTFFLDGVMRSAYEGDAPASRCESEEAAVRLAGDVRTRNAWLAALVAILFVGSVLFLGRRRRTRRP